MNAHLVDFRIFQSRQSAIDETIENNLVDPFQGNRPVSGVGNHGCVKDDKTVFQFPFSKLTINYKKV